MTAPVPLRPDLSMSFLASWCRLLTRMCRVPTAWRGNSGAPVIGWKIQQDAATVPLLLGRVVAGDPVRNSGWVGSISGRCHWRGRSSWYSDSEFDWTRVQPMSRVLCSASPEGRGSGSTLVSHGSILAGVCSSTGQSYCRPAWSSGASTCIPSGGIWYRLVGVHSTR